MFSYFEPNFIEKFLWESGFSNFGQNRSEIKIGYLAAIFKRYNNFIFFFFLFLFLFLFLFCRIVIFYSPYIYGANFIAKFGWESGFLRLGP